MLIDQFITYIESEKRFSKLTASAYRRDLTQFAAYLAKTYELEDLTKVTTLMVKSYVVQLKERGLENRSINRKMSTLRSFYKYCLREQRWRKRP